jgi:predicted RNA-binding protein YlxR (DUF448 family)
VRLALCDGALVVDRAQRLPGRGAYVCADACLARAKRRGALRGAVDRLLSIDAQTVESVG